MSGYVKLWRKSLESPIFSSDRLCRLWCYCLLRANWRPKKMLIWGTSKEITIPRGSFVTGRKALHAALYPDRDADGRIVKYEVAPVAPITLWRNLLSLAQMGCVTISNVSNRCSVVSIVNYEKYQGDDQQYDQHHEQPVNNRRTTGEQPVITIEEGEEGEEGKNTDCSEADKRPTEPPTSKKQLLPDPKPLHVFPVFGCVERNGKNTWTLTLDFVNRLRAACPGVDISIEARKAHVWIFANWSKRKTPDGMEKFLLKWMSREQNDGRQTQGTKRNANAIEYKPIQPPRRDAGVPSPRGGSIASSQANAEVPSLPGHQEVPVNGDRPGNG